MEINEAIKIFLSNKEAEDKSKKTLHWYNEMLRESFRWLEKNGVHDLEDVTKTVLRLYIKAEKNRGVKNTTINCHLRALRAFLNHLIDEEEIAMDNPFEKMKLVQEPKTVIRPFSLQEIDNLIFAAKQTSIPLRNVSIILTLFDTGMRLGELRALTLDAVNFDSDYFIISGKGNKERIAPFGKKLRRVLIKWLKERERMLKGYQSIDWLYISIKRTKLSEHSIEQIIKKIGTRALISHKRCSPHTFRHTFAKMFLENGGNISMLQTILGHTDIKTTQKYLNYDRSDIKRAHRRFSPLDNL